MDHGGERPSTNFSHPDKFATTTPQGAASNTSRLVLDMWTDFEGNYRVKDTAWDDSTLLNLFTRILIGPNYTVGNEQFRVAKLSLMSERGWSIFLPTLDLSDPSEVSPFKIHVRRGVPIRNGVRRQRIEDGGGYMAFSESVQWRVKVVHGDYLVSSTTSDISSLNGAAVTVDDSDATFGVPRVGITSTAFIVTIGIESKKWGRAGVGFREMMASVSRCTEFWKTEPCYHAYPSPQVRFELPKDRGDVFLLGKLEELCNSGRYIHGPSVLSYNIVQTSQNAAARWLVLSKARRDVKCALRDPDTCLN